MDAVELAKESKNFGLLMRSMNVLGSFYSENSPDQGAPKVDKAINIFEEIRRISRTESQHDYHTATLNLANAYMDRVGGDHQANIGQAISLYQEAHDYFEEQGYIRELIRTKNCASTALMEHESSIDPLRFEKAVVLLEEALSHESVHYDNATIAGLALNLACVYMNRTTGGKTANNRLAARMLIQVAQNCGPSVDPVVWAKALTNLSIILGIIYLV